MLEITSEPSVKLILDGWRQGVQNTMASGLRVALLDHDRVGACGGLRSGPSGLHGSWIRHLAGSRRDGKWSVKSEVKRTRREPNCHSDNE